MKNKSPKITVITPTYNRADFIKETIESVLEQDYKDFEYLILDDGSTDNTTEIVKPFLKNKKVKYFYHENQGEAETVNWGWNMAKGEYFTQVNSDDPILPGLFSEMTKVLDKKKNIVVAYPDFYFIDKDGKIIKNDRTPDWNFVQALSDFSCYAASAGSFIRKKPFKNWKKIKDGRFKHISDIYMYWNMALVGDFYHVTKFLATWRDHSNGISSNRWQAIPEIKIWFSEYFKQKNLPKNVIDCKQKTQESMYKYFISLFELSNCKNKFEMILLYKKKLRLDYFDFKNLQIGDNDLVGNKFNGHDLHKYLREKNIESFHLVWNKESDDINTFEIACDLNNKEGLNRQGVRDLTILLQKRYSIDSLLNPFVYDILYNRLFLDSDVVHFHLIHNYIFDINLLPIICRLKPIVWTLHDPWILGGHCIYHYDCDKWKNGCGDCQYLSIPFTINKDNSALNFELKKQAVLNSNFDIIVASKWMADTLKKSPVLKGKNINIVPFGIDQNIFKPSNKNEAKRKLGIPEDAFVIFFRYENFLSKGIDYIDYVLNNLKSKKKIFLLLVGGYKKEIIKYKYKHFGWVKDDEFLASIYNASDLFLMPSKVEAFGMMAIEAMSCEVLPVVLDGTALPDTVDAPKCGVSVKKDKDEYLKTVQYYIEHDDERNKRAKKCLEFARKNYNKEIYINNIIKVYKNAIEKHETTESDKFLLDQLKKYMMVDSQNCNIIDNDEGVLSSHNYPLLFKLLPERYRKKIKKLVFIFFYKLDKVVPIRVRKYLKNKLLSNFYFKKYIIRN